MFSVTRLHPVSLLLETAIVYTFFRAVYFRSNYYCSIHILVDSNGCLGKSGANAVALSDINDNKEVIDVHIIRKLAMTTGHRGRLDNK